MGPQVISCLLNNSYKPLSDQAQNTHCTMHPTCMAPPEGGGGRSFHAGPLVSHVQVRDIFTVFCPYKCHKSLFIRPVS